MPERPRILLVDDSRTVRTHLQLLLGGEFDCLGADSGEAALELLPTLDPRPETILLDVRMPGLGGLETLRRLKAAPEYAGVAVIMVTTRGEEETFSAAKALGCDGFVTKPVVASELFGVLRALARGR